MNNSEKRIFVFENSLIDEKMDEVSEFITKGNFTEPMYSAALVFEEAYMNIATHAYALMPGVKSASMISIERTDNGATMTFVDFGAPFDPTAFDYTSYNPEAGQGGKGIEILHKFTKNLIYARTGNANVLFIEV